MPRQPKKRIISRFNSVRSGVLNSGPTNIRELNLDLIFFRTALFYTRVEELNRYLTLINSCIHSLPHLSFLSRILGFLASVASVPMLSSGLSQCGALHACVIADVHRQRDALFCAVFSHDMICGISMWDNFVGSTYYLRRVRATPRWEMAEKHPSKSILNTHWCHPSQFLTHAGLFCIARMQQVAARS